MNSEKPSAEVQKILRKPLRSEKELERWRVGLLALSVVCYTGVAVGLIADSRAMLFWFGLIGSWAGMYAHLIYTDLLMWRTLHSMDILDDWRRYMDESNAMVETLRSRGNN